MAKGFLLRGTLRPAVGVAQVSKGPAFAWHPVPSQPKIPNRIPSSISLKKGPRKG